jgi:hypothetical protein
MGDNPWNWCLVLAERLAERERAGMIAGMSKN